jgi:EAL domain-containing protein (putative c-di-GMP-specific phosphodiesterase class I)
MADPERAYDILTRINRMGVAIFIDDFGTGYSSLGYLKRLPANAVKIDKSFILNMTADENDAMIVRSIIDLAHNLNLMVIAEGVENEKVWNRLAALGCDAAQGFYMSRPLPAEEMADWLVTSPWGLRPSSLQKIFVPSLPLEER